MQGRAANKGVDSGCIMWVQLRHCATSSRHQIACPCPSDLGYQSVSAQMKMA